jgi:hypothetical protein
MRQTTMRLKAHSRIVGPQQEKLEMWCWERVKKTIWIDSVKKISQRVQKERYFLSTARRRKANWIGQIMRINCLLKHVVKEKNKMQKG